MDETKLDYSIDILEEDIHVHNSAVINILLMDRTMKKNIIWASNDYEKKSELYTAESEMHVSLIIGANEYLIMPRINKSQTHQSNRTKLKAEVFTPSWICNAQNNLIDAHWFGRSNVFNTEYGKSWRVNSKKVEFPDIKDKKWTDYIDSRRLEIACGEAPYLVSRYDTVTAKPISVDRRIGLLDRKLRIVNENTNAEEEWFKWTIRAFQSIYGFEYQGDSLLLARENLLYAFIDNLSYKFNRKPTLPELIKIATILSWNIWQMDGLSLTTPCGDMQSMKRYEQMSFIQNVNNAVIDNEFKFCLIRDWQAYRWKKKSIIEYRSLVRV